MDNERPSASAPLFAFLVPLCFAAVLIVPGTRAIFLDATAKHPYVMGFVKFAFLATAGEILASKISRGSFRFSLGMPLKAAIWGLIGMMITLLFPVFSAGVMKAQASALLPGDGSVFLTALFTSTIMNLTFGAAMMSFHRVTDTMIAMRYDDRPVSVQGALMEIDWVGFVEFVILKTLPIFWIPAHTITFLVPGEYRVFLSASLSIVLGLLLAIAGSKTKAPIE